MTPAGTPDGAVTIQQGGQCLTVTNATLGTVAFTSCVPDGLGGSSSQLWLAAQVNETVAHIHSLGASNMCLGTDGYALALEPCAVEPADCKLHRCYYSALRGWLRSRLSANSEVNVGGNIASRLGRNIALVDISLACDLSRAKHARTFCSPVASFHAIFILFLCSQTHATPGTQMWYRSSMTKQLISS